MTTKVRSNTVRKFQSLANSTTTVLHGKRRLDRVSTATVLQQKSEWAPLGRWNVLRLRPSQKAGEKAH
eukprot:5627008-Amphidinium_carterae.1